jgi:peroxiredoxin
MSENPEPTVGSAAPLFSLPATDGTKVSLASFFPNKNVYLFFVREFI